MNDDRRILRRRLRSARRALTPAQQRKASQELLRQLIHHQLFIRSRHIAFYLANDGEIDPAPLLAAARRLGKHCYLPIVTGWPADRMHFQRISRDQRWTKNRFGIVEPVANRQRQAPVWRLDLVLLPLVGFDSTGNRLGMGGGFYDRTLAYRRRRKQWTRPVLLGLAHHCQKVERLPTASWDIPLDGIVTDQEKIWFQRCLSSTASDGSRSK
ncbi:5-formyltetrahydrofolate cyclo-ligase [Halopseudomonas xinjiangensis]|uniref:5-formyltetrahydrofolate cyclo-ligase n=1 Tax=Halopseudomonas xinjiangensis TaxID=487184 RepID=A0A1H1L9I4_9GAMM|nr:5-formyltetrahydrofolate cyclo-ligase [Halopseudomonas xinjiangensis]SDR70952.1 5-formyltetrahydrofolate cyclo-ligase [Halopseudomonas xinjiangensis]